MRMWKSPRELLNAIQDECVQHETCEECTCIAVCNFGYGDDPSEWNLKEVFK